jgi:Acetoacetate decarboxylase (ADC)
VRLPRRIKAATGRYALVDGIPFTLPVDSTDSRALIAGFTIDWAKAAALLPGQEVHPVRLPRGRGLLLVTVIDYEMTDIGRYIEFSVGIACTHGLRPAPMLLPALFRGRYGTGQYVADLPVSTEISVKGGKGIWGMPKHRASLAFVVADDVVWSQYDLDGHLAMRIVVERPSWRGLPLSMAGVNYCAFRGMLNRSLVYFNARIAPNLPWSQSATLRIGNQDAMQRFRDLEISDRCLFSAYLPSLTGVLDDHCESWFLAYESPPVAAPEGLESVVDLGLGQTWPPPPTDVPGPIPDQTPG